MAAVELAWESQSIRRVGCSAAARQAAKFTAVVVFPTPPFWLATAIIRAKQFLASQNLANRTSRCKLFHVEHQGIVENSLLNLALFHLEIHCSHELSHPCSTCNTLGILFLGLTKQSLHPAGAPHGRCPR